MNVADQNTGNRDGGSGIPEANTAVGEEAPWPKPAYAWYVVFMMLLAYAMATLDRVVIGLMVEPIQRDLRLDDTSMSILIGLAFSLFYTLFGLPLGILIDRKRRTTILGLGIAIWSAATVACGLAKGFVHLFFARMFVGVGEATVTPASSSLIADYFPPDRRARAFGVYMLGGTLGTSLAYLMGSFAIHLSEVLSANGGHYSGLRDWQIVFFLTGLPGIILSLVLFLTVKEPIRREAGKKEDGLLDSSFRDLFRTINLQKLAYLAVIGGAAMNVFLVYAQLSWYPTFFIRVFDVTPKEVGTMLAVIGLPAGTVSALSSGFLMSWIAKKGRTDGPLIIMTAQAIIWGCLGVAKCLAPDIMTSLVFHFFTSLTANWGVPAALMGITQITRNRQRGQMVAVYSLVVGIVAVTLGPLAVGTLSDHVFIERTGIAYSLATVYAVGAALGLAFILVGWKAFNAASKRAAT